jgi:UPF0755 protein
MTSGSNGSSGKRGKGKIILIILLVLVVIGAIGAWFVYGRIYMPNVAVNGKDCEFLYIKTGSTYDDVLKNLESHNYLKNVSSFDWVARRKGYDKKVKPGAYKICSGMSNNKLVNMLRSGEQTPVTLTFNSIRKKEELAGSLSHQLEIDSTEMLETLNNAEIASKYGLTTENILTLFIPNSYQLYWNTSPEKLMARMAKEYKSFWTPERKAKAQAIPLTQAQVSILASIVEKETNQPSEKPIIAGVYINRLKLDMPLEADPTLVWALNDFTIKRVLNEYKKINSPYNTYMYKGLPPGPIYIPAPSSIDAVLNYQKHNFLYFCAKEDMSGFSNFACTYPEHLANAKKYTDELNRRRILH